jgi:hypothetical protein
MPIHIDGPLGLPLTIKGTEVQRMLEAVDSKLTAENLTRFLQELGVPAVPASVFAHAAKGLFSRWVEE